MNRSKGPLSRTFPTIILPVVIGGIFLFRFFETGGVPGSRNLEILSLISIGMLFGVALRNLILSARPT